MKRIALTAALLFGLLFVPANAETPEPNGDGLAVGECKRVDPAWLLCRGGDWFRLVPVEVRGVASVAKD